MLLSRCSIPEKDGERPPTLRATTGEDLPARAPCHAPARPVQRQPAARRRIPEKRAALRPMEREDIPATVRPFDHRETRRCGENPTIRVPGQPAHRRLVASQPPAKRPGGGVPQQDRAAPPDALPKNSTARPDSNRLPIRPPGNASLGDRRETQ